MVFKPLWRGVLASLFILFALVVLSPIGSWFVGRLLVWGASSVGWTVAFEETSGTMVGTLTFHRLSITDSQGTVDLSIERLEIALAKYQVDILEPDLALRLKADSTQQREASDISLPLAFVPEIKLQNGHFLVDEEGLVFRGDGMDATYRATADTSGWLMLSIAQLETVLAEDLVKGRLDADILIESKRLNIKNLRGSVIKDALNVDWQIAGLIGLNAALPIDLTVQTQAQVDSTKLRSNVIIDGTLMPLALGVKLDSKGYEPSIGPVDFEVQASVDIERVQLDSLRGTLLGGMLDGQVVYHTHADSLLVQFRLQQLELAKLPQSPMAGQLDFELIADLSLMTERYVAQLDLNMHDLDLLADKPLDAQLTARLDPDHRLEVTLDAPLGHLEAKGWAKGDRTFDLALSGDIEPAKVLVGDWAPINLVGRLVPDTLEVHLDTERLPFAIGSFGAFQLDMGLRQWRYLHAEGILEEELLIFNLGMDIETARVDTFQAVLSPLALARLENGLLGKLEGQIHGAGILEGDLADSSGFSLNGDFTVSDLGYDMWQSDSLALTLDYAAGIVRVQAEGPSLQSQTSYSTQTELLTGNMQFNGPMIRRVDNTSDTEDGLWLDGHMTWEVPVITPENLAVELVLDTLQIRLKNWELAADGPVALACKDRQIILERLQLNTPVGPLGATGYLGADTIDMQVDLERLDLSPLIPGGTLVGHSQWRFMGSFIEPRITGELALSKVALDTLVLGDVQATVRLVDSLYVEAVLIEKGRQVPKVAFNLAVPAAPLFTGLTESTGDYMHLDIALRQTQWDDLMAYKLGQPAMLRLDIEGQMALPLRLIREPLVWNDLDGYIQVHEGIFELPAADSLQVLMQPGGRLSLNDDSLELSQIHIGGKRYNQENEIFQHIGTLAVDGILHGEQESRLSLVLDELNLGVIGGPEGNAALNAALTGTLDKFDLVADLVVQTLDIGDLQGHLVADNQKGVVQVNWSTPVEDSLDFVAELPWKLPHGQIHLADAWAKVYADGMNLSTFRDLLPQVDDMGGRIHADLHFTGFDESIKANGVVGFDSLKFALVDLQPVYLIPAGQLVFEGQRAFFKDFIGAPENGRGMLSLEGGIDLSNSSKPLLDIYLKSRDLPLRFEDIFNVPSIDMALHFVGDPSDSQLEGYVHMNDALTVPPLIEFNAPPTPPPPPTVPDEFMENMALDIEIDIRQLKVDSELAQVDISGGGHVGGTFYKPTFQADWSIDEGYVLLLNRQFDFEHGRISLNHLVPTAPLLDVIYDPLLLDPDLDMLAATKVMDTGANERSEYAVSLNLQGPLLSVVPEFSAEPALEFESIMTLLAFSSTQAENPAYGTALGTAAGQLLLSKRIEDVGLDEFNILPSGTSLSTVGQPSILMGKFFKNLPLPLWVRYEAAIKDFSLGEVRVEHRLNSFITISGSAESTQERYGLGIGLKKAF